MWIDGTEVHSTATLDNNRSAVDFVRLGAISMKGGASGAMRWDEFEPRRASSIGLP